MADETKVVTGVVRLSYANIWEPKSINGGDEKYSVSLLVPKSDTATITKINNAVEVARQEGKSKWGGKIPAVLKLPLRDGDEEKADDPVYEGHYFFNATSKNKPQILDLNRKEIEVDDDVYSGCYARAVINFYAFNANGNKGVAAGLNGIQKVKDGERLSGGGDVSKDFDDGFMPDFDEEDDFLS